MKIVSVVGARPEFVQVAVLSPLLRERHVETLIHTGQHYDRAMSDRFFIDLGIPDPEINLGIATVGASQQTGDMLQAIARVLAQVQPDLVIVRGDTTSTLAGALAAKQALIPLVHIEGGMRSYDRTMPEELNRIVADHIADIALVTDDAARERLAAEGITRDVHVCGDVMYDVFLRAQPRARAECDERLRAIASVPYDLLTLHRAENTDDAGRLRAIVAGFSEAPRRIVFPCHPRTAARLRDFGIGLPDRVVVVEPLGYLEMVALESDADRILTDSGGVQREAYFAGVPALTLRDTTEWTNTVDAGWNRLLGARTDDIRAALAAPAQRPRDRPALFGDGNAAGRIVAELDEPRTRAIVEEAARVRRARGR